MRDWTLFFLFAGIAVALSVTAAMFLAAGVGRFLGAAWAAAPSSWLPAFGAFLAPPLAAGLWGAWRIGGGGRPG